MRNKMKKAQGATEYTIFIAAVLAGLIAMQIYYQRSIKGNMRIRADSIGEQFDSTGGNYTRRSTSLSRRNSTTNLDGVWTKSSVTDATDKTASLEGSVQTLFTGSKSATVKAGEVSYTTGSDNATTFNMKQGDNAWSDIYDKN